VLYIGTLASLLQLVHITLSCWRGSALRHLQTIRHILFFPRDPSYFWPTARLRLIDISMLEQYATHAGRVPNHIDKLPEIMQGRARRVNAYRFRVSHSTVTQ
jgi:hypothetical protein